MIKQNSGIAFIQLKALFAILTERLGSEKNQCLGEIM